MRKSFDVNGMIIFIALTVVTPLDISFSAKGMTALGIEYSTYTVYCSDGTKREITMWDKRKKWCIGTTRQCTNDQVETAKQACMSRS